MWVTGLTRAIHRSSGGRPLAGYSAPLMNSMGNSSTLMMPAKFSTDRSRAATSSPSSADTNEASRIAMRGE